jgi:hypothetical protein
LNEEGLLATWQDADPKVLELLIPDEIVPVLGLEGIDRPFAELCHFSALDFWKQNGSSWERNP